MLVSINIVAYNEEKNIEKSLLSALNQSHGPIEVFLIDNSSKDRTIDIARKAYQNSGSNVKLEIIKNEKNLGFGGGHNVGIEKSTGAFILCLNADCELDKDYVKNAVGVFNLDNKIGGVQGKLINRRTNKLDTTGLLIFKNRRVINRGQGEADSGQYEKIEEIWGVDGAAPVYRREALNDSKIQDEYFDEDFFCYKEDIDLSWRMRLAGWNMFYQPKAIAYHDRSAGEGTAKKFREIIEARKKISEFAKFHSFANQRLMEIKNETPRLFLKYLPLIFLKEMASWSYVLSYEKYGWKSAVEFFKLAPRAWKKRKYVMEKKRIMDKDIERWFV